MLPVKGRVFGSRLVPAVLPDQLIKRQRKFPPMCKALLRLESLRVLGKSIEHSGLPFSGNGCCETFYLIIEGCFLSEAVGQALWIAKC